MPKGGGRFRKIPGGIRKFPLLFSRRVCYTMGVVGRRLPARCDGSFLSSHFVIGDVGSVCGSQASRLPFAAGSWKRRSILEATHLCLKVQVITRSTRPPRDSFIRQKGLLCSPFFSLFSDMCHTISAVLPRMASNAIWYLHIAAQSFIMTGYVTNHAALCRATTFKLERMDNK